MTKKKTYILGVSKVKHGEEPADGGYPTNYDKQFQPYQESVTFEDADGELVKHFYQGARYPFLSIYQAAGTELKVSVPMDLDNLVEWMGGRIVAGQWEAPRGNYQATKAIEIMTEFGVPITIPRATCYGVRRFGKKTTDVSLIEITIVVELPTDADTAPMYIGEKEGAAPAQAPAPKPGASPVVPAASPADTVEEKAEVETKTTKK